MLNFIKLIKTMIFFSYGWGKDEGSSDEPGNVFFRGARPFSEPETQAIRVSPIQSSELVLLRCCSLDYFISFFCSML